MLFSALEPPALPKKLFDTSLNFVMRIFYMAVKVYSLKGSEKVAFLRCGYAFDNDRHCLFEGHEKSGI